MEIAAARGLLGISWFDAVKTKRGMSGLRGYRRSKMGKPIHDWASHPADAFRTLATGFHLVGGISSRSMGGGSLRRRIRGII